MKSNNDYIMLCIPAFNEEGRISKVINSCKKYFKNIIVIEDGSNDLTYEESLQSSPTVILKHSINCG